MDITEIFAKRQEAMGLSDWEINKIYCTLVDESNPNRTFTSTRNAIADLTKCRTEKMLLLFKCLGVNVETAIAIAATSNSKA